MAVPAWRPRRAGAGQEHDGGGDDELMVSIHHVSAPATRPSESPATTAGGLARVGHLSLFSQSNKIQVPHCEEDMTQRHDNIPGIDDVVAELALARRARLRALASRPSSTCGRRFNTCMSRRSRTFRSKRAPVCCRVITTAAACASTGSSGAFIAWIPTDVSTTRRLMRDEALVSGEHLSGDVDCGRGARGR